MAKMKTRKVSTGKGRSLVGGFCFLGMFCVLIGGVIYTFKSQQMEIEVVTFKRDVAIGTKITEADVERGTILRATYDSKDKVEWVSNDGVAQKGQIYIKWDDCADEVIGKYVTNSGRLGDYITQRDLTDEEIEPNPWYTSIPVGNELYTMKFDSDDVYTRMLLPGATVRMRIITEIPITKAEEYRKKIAQKTAGVADDKENANGYISAILPFYNDNTEGDGNSSKDVKVPVAEIVFNNLTILDAMNSNGESIFDIYYSLSNLDSTVREKYIRENSSDLISRLVPDSLIMSLNEEQATAIAEFENVKTKAYKYTVVKTEEGNELYSKFMDIATRINTITINTSEE